MKKIHIRGPSDQEGESSSTGAPTGNSPEETIQETLVVQDQQLLAMAIQEAAPLLVLKVTRWKSILKKSFKLLFDDEEVLVPGEAPYFQWNGMIFDESKANFNNVEDCVERFERVLTAYTIDVEDNWKRILPARLVGAVARWYAGLNDIATWSQFKDLLIQKYGRRRADIKEEAREKLDHLSFHEPQNFKKFIEEFQELQVAADIKGEDCLVRYLFKALPEGLANSTKLYINNATNNGEITIKFAIEKVVATYDALFNSKWTRGAPCLENAVVGYNGGFFGGNTQDSQRDDGSNPRANSKGGYKRRSQNPINGQASHKSPRLERKYHPGLTNHSEVACILPIDVKKNIDKAYKKYGAMSNSVIAVKHPTTKKAMSASKRISAS